MAACRCQNEPMNRRRLTAVVLAAMLGASAACGSKTSPSPQPGGGSSGGSSQAYTITGTVTSQGSGAPIAAARVDVVAGATSGQATNTDAGGRYTFANVPAGTLTVRASAPGFASQTSSITVAGDMTTNFGLLAGTFITNGRALDAIGQTGIAGISLSGDGIISTASDAAGSFSVIASATTADPRLVLFTAPNIVERRTNVRVPGGDISVSLIPTSFDLRAFDEMFRVPMLLRWTTAPPLLVENRALIFTNTSATDQTSLADQMSDAEYSALVTDLGWALPLLTGGTFQSFAGITRQVSAESVPVHILNTGVITVARVVGLTASTGYWGYSRWQFRSDGTITGGIVTLDRDFERGPSLFHRSLRAHELGHALGYNHVTVRASVMNSAATIEPNGFDLDACKIAFQRTPGNRSPDNDPSFWSTNAIGGALTWSAPIR